MLWEQLRITQISYVTQKGGRSHNQELPTISEVSNSNAMSVYSLLVRTNIDPFPHSPPKRKPRNPKAYPPLYLRCVKLR